MSESLISVLLEQLITKWTAKVVRLVHVEKDVSSLNSKLEAVQTVFENEEMKYFEDPAVRRWLDQLKHVSYDIINVLDEWSTELLISEIQNQADAEEGDRHNVIVSKMKKVCSSLLTQLKQVGVRHEVAVKVKELNETLEKIKGEREGYSLETTKVLIPERRETTSLVNESEIYGRDGDKEFIVSKLLCNDSHGGESPAIIPLVGMGGIGKTTLAQLAFNDDKVKAHFDERVWVCVSDPFNGIQIAKAIVEALERRWPELETLEPLLQRVKNSIRGKKFLLVLDDVWCDDHEKWEQLKQSLQDGAPGSRIVITTRKTEVATMMGVAKQVINLELLCEEHCWLIFKGFAFHERSSEECKQLERIETRIARKCKGLPLVAKTLGCLMCYKEAKDWEGVLSSRIWESQDDNIKHFAPFLLSYYDLPRLERHCFSYCSVFQKDHEFEVDDLIETWMSQPFLSSTENPEKVGQRCFDNLSNRSFFQDFVRGLDGRILTCKMHDILHDLALFLRRHECVAMKIVQQLKEPPSVEKVRHATLILTTETDKCVRFPTKIFSQNKLNSLFTMRTDIRFVNDATTFFDGTSDVLRYLRTLNLSGCGVYVVPKQLGQLRHLRYLNLSDNRFTELPDEVCGFCNLQTLRIERCDKLERLPEGMGKLLKLRHLHIRRDCGLEGLPKGVGRLAQLQTLDELVIPENNEKYLSIEDLVLMNHLRLGRVLRISGCRNFKNLDEVEKAAGLLINGEDVVELILPFPSNCYHPGRFLKDESILDALQPKPSLRSLEIRHYNGVNLNPKWMTSLSSLTQLHLISCETCETLPPLGSLPSLERLVMAKVSRMRKLGREFMGFTEENEGIAPNEENELILFPKLKRLDVSQMDRLEEWEDCESTNSSLILMPRLEVLQIHFCSALTSLPYFLKEVPLKHLSIRGCSILSKSLRRSAQRDIIAHIPNFINDDDDFNRFRRMRFMD